jgi:CheY-like chemotaxis protein
MGGDMKGVGGWRVLVAEDNPLNYELLHDLLGSLGHSVEWARDGQEAVAAMSGGGGGGFDLLLLDLHLPVFDGLEVLRRLERPAPPVVALTADATLDVREAMLAAGAEACLPKPLDLGALIRLLSAIGALSDQAPSAPQAAS